MRSGDGAISERDAHGERAKVWSERGPNREGRGARGQPTTIALRNKRGTRITCVLCSKAHYVVSPERCQLTAHALRVDATKRLSSTVPITRSPQEIFHCQNARLGDSGVSDDYPFVRDTPYVFLGPLASRPVKGHAVAGPILTGFRLTSLPSAYAAKDNQYDTNAAQDIGVSQVEVGRDLGK